MQNAALYSLTVLIWSSTWFIITFQLGVVDPFLSLAYRFALATGCLFIFCLVTGRFTFSFTIKQHGYCALLGLCLFCLNYWFIYSGSEILTSGIVAICFSTFVVFTVINQLLFFRTRVEPQIVLGSLIGMSGLTLVFWPEIQAFNPSDDALRGALLCLAGTYLASLGNMVVVRNDKDGMPMILSTALGMLYGTLLCFLFAIVTGAEINFDPSVSYIASLLYLGIVGSAVAFITYLTLLRNIGASRAGYATVLYPIVALMISTLLEGYAWTAIAVLGVVLTLVGNIVCMTDTKTLRTLLKQNAA